MSKRSPIEKYLHQKASIRYALRDTEGNPILDDYGEPQYQQREKTFPCRREKSVEDVITTNGAVKKNTSIYFFGPKAQIDLGDKVDGKVVLTVTDFIDLFGECWGYEVRV